MSERSAGAASLAASPSLKAAAASKFMKTLRKEKSVRLVVPGQGVEVETGRGRTHEMKKADRIK